MIEYIKRNRISRKMTQGQLAEALGVDILVVASWENGSSVPGDDMKKKLEEVFSSSVATSDTAVYEEYKRKKDEKANKKLFAVFGVLGSLFVGVGVIILMVGLWDKFPGAIKGFISFLPMLLAQAVAMFTYKKKFDNVVWREGASILWSLGVTATIGLISMVLGLHFGAGTCLLIDTVLILPIAFAFKTISPMGFYYIYALCGTGMVCEQYPAATAVILTCLMALGVLFGFFARKHIDRKRYNCVAIASVIFTFYSLIFLTNMVGWGKFSVLGAAAVLLCAVYNKDEKGSHSFVPGYAVAVLTSLMCVKDMLRGELTYSFECGVEAFLTPEYILVALITIAALAYGFFTKTFKENKNRLHSAFCLLGAAGVLVTLVDPLIESYMITGLILFAITFVQGLVLLINGMNEKNYFTLNTGLVEILVLVFYVFSAFDWDLVTVGLMFLIVGVSFFGANFYLSRKTHKAPVIEEEVVYDEE